MNATTVSRIQELQSDRVKVQANIRMAEAAILLGQTAEWQTAMKAMGELRDATVVEIMKSNGTDREIGRLQGRLQAIRAILTLCDDPTHRMEADKAAFDRLTVEIQALTEQAVQDDNWS